MLRRNILVLLFIGLLLAWAYQNLYPPPPLLCGSPGGPPVTGPRVVLRDGRHLAYNEYGVSRDVAKYKIVFVHGFSSCRFDESVYHPVSISSITLNFLYLVLVCVLILPIKSFRGIFWFMSLFETVHLNCSFDVSHPGL